MEVTDAAAELFERRQARKGLLAYTQYTHPRYQVGMPHKIIADALNDVLIGKCDRLMICMPPRHGKSELASRRFPAFALGHYPHWQVISAGATQQLADEFGRDVRNIIDGIESKAIFPGLSLAEDSQARGRWATANGGIYHATGVGGSIMGVGGDLIVIDDPYSSWDDAQSENSRRFVWDWYRNTIYNRMMPNARIVVINHRMHEEDLCGSLIAEEAKGGDKWRKIILPAVCQGEALWPERYGVDALNRIRAVMSPVAYSALYLQDPTPDDGIQFRAEWWRYADVAPDRKYLSVYMSGDFAVTEAQLTKDDPDYTVFKVWGVDHNKRIFPLDCWSGQVNTDVSITRLVQMFKDWKPEKFVAEAGVIRRAIEPFLVSQMRKEGCFVVLEWVPTVTDKVAASSSFQGLMSNGQVFWPMVSWAAETRAEMLKFPNSAHDDRVDACSRFGQMIHQVWEGQAPPETPARPEWDKPLMMKDLFKVRKRA